MRVIHVDLGQGARVELVDEEIVTVGGCDLGFIMEGKPPQVLQVEAGSEMASRNIRTDDVLVGVDGRDTRSASKGELEEVLRGASRLTFERPGEDAGDDMETAPPQQDGAAPAPVDEPASAADVARNTPTGDVPTQVDPARHREGDAAAQGGGETGDARHDHLRPGMCVRLVGFQTPDMNGLQGKLGKYSESKRCWQVFLEGSTTAKAVRPGNLELVASQEELPRAHEGRHPRAQVVRPPANGVALTPEQTAALAAHPMGMGVLAALRGGGQPLPMLHYDGPGPPPGPEWQEDALPMEEDKESWVELLRDALSRQLRADAELPEPPPFHRASHFGASASVGQRLPDGKFPSQALNFQLQMLHRARTLGEYQAAYQVGPYGYGQGYNSGGWWSSRWGKGGKGFGGGYGPAPRRDR